MSTPEVNELATHYNPRSYYEGNQRIKRVVDFIKDGIPGKNFESIYNYLVNSDPYMNLADFESYCAAHERVNEAYKDKDRFTKMSLTNIANAGMFASDRSVTDYAEEIWHTKPVE